MLLRRSCPSSKPIEYFYKSKAANITYRLAARSFTSGANDSRSAPCHETLTLLHKAVKLLPRALPQKSQSSPSLSTETVEFWDDILSGAYEDLTSVADRPARIAVHGFGKFSGAQDLVTALLDEPLSSDSSQTERIRNRWKDRVEAGNLVISTSASSQPSTLVTQSTYLRQFPVPIEITEVPSTSYTTPHDHSPTQLIDEPAARALLQADVAIIACNPLTTPLSTLFQTPLFTKNPNAILILSHISSPPSETTSTLLSRFASSTTPHEPVFQGREILFIDPARAMAANKTLSSDPSSPAVIQKYQDEFMGSKISMLITTLRAALFPDLSPSKSSLQNQTTLAQLRGALYTCHTSLKKVRHEMEAASVAVSRLNGRLEEAKAKVRGEVLGQTPEYGVAKASTDGDIVGVALKDAEKEMRKVMDHLTWWRMASRIDEISAIISQTLQRSWCRDLEKQLILHTGRLSALQSDVTNSTFSLLSTHSTPPFKSAVLENTLNQLKASQSYRLTPQTLTGPIVSRSAQIVQYPTTSLHVAGQRAMLGMIGGVVGGAGLGWAGWVGWLVGSGEGLLGMIGMDAGTAMGVGALGATAAVRWAVGTWERSKRRWWEDWARVSDGLGRDLRDTLDKTMQENVLVVGTVGCNNLSDMVAKRREEIKVIEEDLQTLHKELERLEQRQPPHTTGRNASSNPI